MPREVQPEGTRATNLDRAGTVKEISFVFIQVEDS